jgi:hypothetical protein
MLPFINQVNLIRYLIVWRVTGSFVQVPQAFAADISRTLGTLIAERLPTQQARPWRKWLASWGEVAAGAEEAADARPEPTKGEADRWPSWPIETIVWPYPAKHGYGLGEPILWELKLLGDAADHGLFLEVLLPAMEAAATTSDERWHRPRTLWGRFEIQAVYAAHGARWEPLVRDGRLDLSYRPTPNQWAEGLAPQMPPEWKWLQLTWLTPFDLRAEEHRDRPAEDAPAGGRTAQGPKPPSMMQLMDALMARLAGVMFGKWGTPDQAWALLPEEERAALRQESADTRQGKAELERAEEEAPGCWIGSQRFLNVSPRLAPYLELAAILHLGRYTHFGCGTFTLL